MSYYNTTRQKGEQLKVSWKKTKSQDNKVMDYFNEHGRATPSEVWLHFNKYENNVPITSIRRSITNLTGDNKAVRERINSILKIIKITDGKNYEKTKTVTKEEYINKIIGQESIEE